MGSDTDKLDGFSPHLRFEIPSLDVEYTITFSSRETIVPWRTFQKVPQNVHIDPFQGPPVRYCLFTDLTFFDFVKAVNSIVPLSYFCYETVISVVSSGDAVVDFFNHSLYIRFQPDCLTEYYSHFWLIKSILMCISLL